MNEVPVEPAVRRKRGVRFTEIAAAAGVSLASVDRVLNERGNVSSAVQGRVIEAARRLAVPRVLPDIRHGLLHVDVLLPANDTPFFQRLRLALQRSVQMLEKRVVVHRTIIGSEQGFIDAINATRYPRAGLILTAWDSPAIRAALQTVIAAGTPVVTLVTDIETVERRHYAGIDNVSAGRTAAFFVDRLGRAGGDVLVLSSRADFGAHRDRLAGFRSGLAASFRTTPPTSGIETHDDPDLCYRSVVAALKRGDLAAVYNSGYGASGIAAALDEFGMAGKVVWIGHEITDEHRRYVERGMMDIVIDQDPDGQVLSALQHVLHACGVIAEPPACGPVEFGLFCRANVRRTPYLQPSAPPA
ncbi:MAG: LacI family DNA-binding transcriptional regulator [Janthinobacterium lividum]